MSIITALEARRDALREREAGFTLIELLVVVIIIGILAAIAVPIYIGVQNNAKDKAAQSDLTNARVAIIAYYGDKGTFPAPSLLNSSMDETAGLGKWGFPSVSGTNSAAAVTNASSGTAKIDAFCLKAASDAGSVFYVLQQGQPTSTKPTGCA